MVEDCLFCKMVTKEVPAEVVYEDDACIAVLDINPRNVGHTLVIPKQHHETILDLPDDILSKAIISVKNVAKKVSGAVKASGISISQSNGAAAGQVIKHVHFHVIPRFSNEPPPGLESMLPVKRLTPDMLKKVAEAIRSGGNQEEKMIDEFTL